MSTLNLKAKALKSEADFIKDLADNTEEAEAKAILKAEAEAKEEALITSDEAELSVKALCLKILNIRYEAKNINSLIAEALKLAIYDYVIHKNKNSLKVLVLTRVDKKSLFNLPYVKDFFNHLGLFLSYNAKEEALTIDEFKRFNSEEALEADFKAFKEASVKAKKEEAKALKEAEEEEAKKEALALHKAKEEALKKILKAEGIKSASLEEALKLLK